MNSSCRHSFCKSINYKIDGIALLLTKKINYTCGDETILSINTIISTKERFGRFKEMHSLPGGQYEEKDGCVLKCACREYCEEIHPQCSDYLDWKAFDKIFKSQGYFKTFLFQRGGFNTLVFIGVCPDDLTRASFSLNVKQKDASNLPSCYKEIDSIEFIDIDSKVPQTFEKCIYDYTDELSPRDLNPSSYLKALLSYIQSNPNLMK